MIIAISPFLIIIYAFISFLLIMLSFKALLFLSAGVLVHVLFMVNKDIRRHGCSI
jgi:hypothetical protein